MLNLMPPHGWSIALVIWGAIGPLAGILVGHFLTRSWQSRQWLLDRRNEEWRELLTALSESLRMSVRVYPGRLLNSDDQQEIIVAHENCVRTIRDRIFIAREVRALDIESLWAAALIKHNRTLDANAIGAVYDEIRLKILNVATNVNFRHKQQ